MIRGLLTLLAAPTLALANPLASTTAVHTRPEATSPTITILSAGTNPVPASNPASAADGWTAIELSGPFEGYVENKDLSKSLDVKPGAAIRLAPKADAGVLTLAEKGDRISITGLRGKWTQINLERKLTGYVQTTTPATNLPRIAQSPAAPAPVSPAPVAPAAYGFGGVGQPAPMVNLGDAQNLPRQFAGRFVSTRRALTPRRPYDFALNDDAGKRYAYLDLSKLLLTEQIESYLEHSVVVFGTARAVPGGKDIVIEVETLQLR